MKKVVLTLVVLFYIEVQCVQEGSKLKDAASFNNYLCNGSGDITISHKPHVAQEEQNSYSVFINKLLTKNTKIVVTLDSDGSITLDDKSFARIFLKNKNRFDIRIFKLHDGIFLNIKGQSPGTVPHMTSLVINNKEFCSRPVVGHLDGVSSGHNDISERVNRKSQGNCGRRKAVNTNLISSYNAASTKPGDWPWHTAIYKHDNTEIKYICGGTLITNNFVLTAAQCTSLRGVPFPPNILSVFLGKFNLIGGDVGAQEKQVDKIIVHENFAYQNIDNDIALLKLKTNVAFSDFVQPACLWRNEGSVFQPTDEIFGTIVGWGFDTLDSWSPHLQQTKMPMVAESTCLRSNPLVFSTILNSNKFCAGYGVRQQETRSSFLPESARCNGDSGSAFQIFIPDNAEYRNSETSGEWYVRGIVSLTVSRPDSPVCDPQQYIVFTDVEKYRDWLDHYLNNEHI